MHLKSLLGTLVLGGILATAAQASSDAKTSQASNSSAKDKLAQMTLDSRRAAADRWYKQGRKHLQQGEYDEARLNLEEAVKLDPQLIGAYKGLAKAWQLLREPGREIEVLEQAIENNPVPEGMNSSGHLLQTDARLWLYMDLAACFKRQGQDDRATRTLRECLAADPGFWGASRFLAVHLNGIRDEYGADRAIDTGFDKLCTPKEGPQAHSRRVRAITAVIELYEELGRPKAAERFMR